MHGKRAVVAILGVGKQCLLMPKVTPVGEVSRGIAQQILHPLAFSLNIDNVRAKRKSKIKLKKCIFLLKSLERIDI